MPVVFIEAPSGIRPDPKKRMVQEISRAIGAAYPVGETLVFLREYPLENLAVAGELQSANPKVVALMSKMAHV